jgi:hypothetical protein
MHSERMCEQIFSWNCIRICFQVSAALFVEIVAFGVVTPCNIVGGYQISEEHAAFVFRVDVSGIGCSQIIWYSST